MSRVRVAVIGVGHLGKEHARILAGMPDVELVGVVDTNAEQAQAVATRYQTKAYLDYRPLLNQIDAASIVVPTVFHHQVACDLIQNGIPLLVEKPLAATLSEAEQLVQLANKNDVVLQVGHIERFNPAYEELSQRPLRPKYINAERIGPFTGRSTDIGVVLDLMIHDLDLLLDLVGSAVQSVDALGVSIFGQHEDVANARLHFACGCVANITASRASPVPSRRMHLWGPEGYARIDFGKRHLSMIQPSDYLRRNGLDPNQLDPVSRSRLKEDLYGQYLNRLQLDCNRGDQLTRELSHFIHCTRTGSQPRVSGEDALKAMSLADRVLASIRSHHWEGQGQGPTGPENLPAPQGKLFPGITSSEAAA